MTTLPSQPLTTFDENAQHIARRQYLQPGDGDIGGMFRRIANWVAGAEAPDARLAWAQKYYDLMAGKKFCPGGRVLAGAGTQHGNVLNCFVQGATEHDPSSFEGVMEVAKKLALVTKVGGGNGVNLDVYRPRAEGSRPDAGVRGWAYMSAAHPDVSDFVEGLMRPPTQPDGDKQPVAVRNWTRVVYGQAAPPELIALARQNGVAVVRALPEGVQSVPDDMGGIVDAARKVAEDAKLGLEPRLDLSAMRAEGAPIRGSGGTSSGPVSFLMEIFDNFLEWANRGAEQAGPINTLRFVYAPVLRVVRQGGTRRGAGMATISIAHPDVLDFLTAKDLDREASEGDISTFNISILISAAFWDTLQAGGVWPMQAQEVPGKYYLAEQAGEFAGQWPELPDRPEDGARGVPVYRVGPDKDAQSGIPAAWLWDQIAQHAWSTGEPGLIFNDRVNEFSALKNLGERYEIRSTNPCGEIPLTVGEPCDLGAINLAAYVRDSTFDFATFRADVRTCVRFLDDVLDVNVFALEDNRVASQDLRRLGLGVMGLADALIKLGLRYDHAAGREMIMEIMSVLREEAVAESERLGEERGVYPVYERNREQMPHAPRRNVAVLTVAPTGCVVPNTLVSTDRGMRRIVTLGSPSGKQWQDIEFGVHTDEGVRAATKFFVNGYRPVRRVTTTRGFSLAATDNHRVRALDGEGHYVWRRMDELNVGDAVLLKRNTLDDAPMAQLELAEIGVNGVSTVPDRMSPDLAELLGLYMGNGYLKERGGLHIVVANVDADLKERVAVQLMRVFTSRTAPVEERVGCAVVAVNGRCIPRFFALNNLVKPKGAAGEGAEGAFIPDVVLASGARAVRAFLRGIFESDGTVTPQGGVALSSVSLTLLQQTQAALLGLGIVSGIRQMPAGGGRFGQRPIFELRLLNRHEVVRFRERIGFLSARKQAKLASIAKGQAKCDVITHPVLLEEFYQASRGLDNQTRQGLNKRVHSNKAVSQPYIKDLIARHPQLQETRLGRLVARDVFVDTVALIEEGFSETYDLSVPENVTYVAGGFISHNTTSMLMGVSSGIEPVFSPFIWRKIGSEYRALLAPLFVELLETYPAPNGMSKAGGWDWDRVTEAVSENHGSVVGLPFIPDALQQVFVCAHDIAPADHVRMQGTVQQAFDADGHAANSLSKTINLPNSATVQDVQDAYSEAYRTGCKGITVYRDGSRQFQVLSTSKKKEKKEGDAPAQAAAEIMGEQGDGEKVMVDGRQPQPTPPSTINHQPSTAKPQYERPARLSGITDMVKLTDPTSGHRRSFLVTVNHLNGKPVEVMVISGRAGDEANADSEALGRVVSIALQHGVPAQALVKTLRGINGGLYGSYNGRLVGSKADLIAVALETFQKDMAAPAATQAAVQAEAAALPPLAGGSGVSVDSMDAMTRERCPVCEERAVIREEGCLKCQACGYSKCG